MRLDAQMQQAFWEEANGGGPLDDHALMITVPYRQRQGLKEQPFKSRQTKQPANGCRSKLEWQGGHIGTANSFVPSHLAFLFSHMHFK